MSNVQELIDRMPLFAGLPSGERRRLAMMEHTFIRYDKDEPIIRENSRGRSLYVIISGSVRITRNSRPTKSIATLRAGTLFGEISFLTGSPRSTNVIANDSVVVMKLDRRTLNQLNPEVRESIKDRLIELLAARIKKMNDVLVRIGL